MRSPRRRGGEKTRRRYVVSYLLSIIVHFVVGAFFIIRALAPAGGAAAEVPNSETVAITQDRPLVRTVASDPPPTPPTPPAPNPTTPQPETPRPLRPIATPQPTALPTRLQLPKPKAKPVAARTTTRRPELAKIVHDASPQPARIVVIAPVITASPTPQAETPTPATPAPTERVAPRPTIATTSVPTQAPTLAPTAAPTVAPIAVVTAPPTSVPPIEPTQRPAPPPTAPPTLAPTLAPTTVPTLMPTLAPTQRPATPQPAAIPAVAAPATAQATVPPATAVPPVSAAPVPVAASESPVKTTPSIPDSAATATATRGPTVAPKTASKRLDSVGSETAATDLGTGRTATTSGVTAPESANVSKEPKPAARSGASVVANRPNSDSAPIGNANNGALDKLNGRLNGLLPQGDPVAYSNKHYTNTLDRAVDEVRAEYYAAAAPPPSVLEKVIKIVQQHGTSLDHPSAIVYIIKRQRLFGLEICTGWKVETPDIPGAKPQGGYTIGSCGGEEFTPPAGLPTPPPKSP